MEAKSSAPRTSTSTSSVAELEPGTVAQFGPFSFDFDRGELFCEERQLPLRPLPTRALACLLHGDGRLVSREQLRSALWGDQFVDWEAGLHQCIRHIRRALEAGEPGDHIVTVPRRGYRMGVEVTWTRRGQSRRSTPIHGRGKRLEWGSFAAGAATVVALPVVVVLVCALLAGA